jgi:hypothetical protein
LYSPAIDYAVYHEDALAGYLATINRLLAAKGFAPMTLAHIRPGYAQMKVMVDLLHVYGIAVMFDVVHNHAGGWGQTYTVPKTVDPSGLLPVLLGPRVDYRAGWELRQQPEPVLYRPRICGRPGVCAVECGCEGISA